MLIGTLSIKKKLLFLKFKTLKEKRRSYKPAIDTENIDRSKLRMRDLLYYNPKNRAKYVNNEKKIFKIS